MADLLIRDIDPELKRQIEERANAHRRSLSEEAKSLIRTGLTGQKGELKLGTALSHLIAPEDWGDDLVFEIPEPIRSPPDFE
jgi:plasmid stability protein